jgi:dTDP-6-deoxy-L-talose 4-dehydrogenase (NAD+)
VTRTVLLTGAAGFIGRQVLVRLTERGAAVRAVVRAGTKVELPADDVAVITTPDLFAESATWWADACAGVDTIIHVAWYAEPGKYPTSERNLDCLVGTLRLAQGAARSNVRRFVGIGSCLEYDGASSVPLAVDTPLKPLTPYAAAKAAAFLTLSRWLPLQRIEFCWCRVFYLSGEGEDSRRLVPYLRAKLAAGEPALLTSGNQVRDHLDVREVGRLIATHALGDETGPINVCSGIPMTIRQLAERIADEYGRRDLLKFGARPDNPLDPPYIVGVKKEIKS